MIITSGVSMGGEGVLEEFVAADDGDEDEDCDDDEEEEDDDDEDDGDDDEEKDDDEDIASIEAMGWRRIRLDRMKVAQTRRGPLPFTLISSLSSLSSISSLSSSISSFCVYPSV